MTKEWEGSRGPMTDEEWEKATADVRQAAKRYEHVDVRALAEEGAREFQRERELQKQRPLTKDEKKTWWDKINSEDEAEREQYRISQRFINSILVVAMILILYLVFR